MEGEQLTVSTRKSRSVVQKNITYVDSTIKKSPLSDDPKPFFRIKKGNETDEYLN